MERLMNTGTPSADSAAEADPSKLDAEALVRRREALLKMSKIVGVGGPAVLAVLRSDRALACSGTECSET